MGILDGVFGGGNAWLEEGWGGQQAVVDHAKQLGYPGVIAPAGSDKRTWTTFTDAFNAWKARKGWLDNAVPAEESGGDLGRGASPSSDYYSNPTRQNNPYFPMLYESFTPPPMQDWSGMPGFENSIFGQEYYQPWADNYPGSQWTPYEPPVFNTPIEYMSPLFALEVMFEEEEEEGGSDGDKKSGTPKPGTKEWIEGGYGMGDGTGDYGTADDPFGFGIGSTSSGVEASQTFGIDTPGEIPASAEWGGGSGSSGKGKGPTGGGGWGFP